MNKDKILLAVAVVLVLSAVVYYLDSDRVGERACTLEAKLCPDGSYVGRTGPNCEFAPCPAQP